MNSSDGIAYSGWSTKFTLQVVVPTCTPIGCTPAPPYLEIKALQSGFVDNQFGGINHKFYIKVTAYQADSWLSKYNYYFYKYIDLVIEKDCSAAGIFNSISTQSHLTSVFGTAHKYNITTAPLIFTFNKPVLNDIYCNTIETIEVIKVNADLSTVPWPEAISSPHGFV